MDAFNRLILQVFFSFFLVLPQVSIAQDAAVEDSVDVVVKLDHFTDDLHAAFMALKIANGLEEKDQNVVLFLNLEAVRLAHGHQPVDLAWGHNEDFSVLLNRFIEHGGKILVCPHCANSIGMHAEDMREGITIAEEGEVIDAIMAADKVVSY